MSFIALPLVGVLVLHAGQGGMGLLTAAAWAPNLLLSLHAGAWVDRSGRPREAMIAADLGRAALLVTVPVAWALGVLTFGQLVAVAFATGALGALASVAYGSLYGALVHRDRLVEAGALVGGSLGGRGRRRAERRGAARVAILTAPFAVLADAASFIASALWLRRVAVPRRAHNAVPGGLADGVRFIARSPLVRPMPAAATATLNVFTFAISALFILYATRSLGVSPATLGIVLGAGAIGGVLGSLVTGRIVDRIGVGAAFAAGCVLFTAPLLLIPLASGPQPAVLGLLFLAEFGAGFGVMVLDISAGAILVAAVPETLRARMFGAYQLVNYGVRPIGALGGGALGAAIGLQPTLWIAGVGAVASVLWLLPSPVPRMRALPET